MSSFARPIDDDEPMPIEQSWPRFAPRCASDPVISSQGWRTPAIRRAEAGRRCDPSVAQPLRDGLRCRSPPGDRCHLGGSRRRCHHHLTIARFDPRYRPRLGRVLGRSQLVGSDASPQRCQAPGGHQRSTSGHRTIDQVAFADPEQPLVTLVPSGDFSPRDQSRLARSPPLEVAIDHLLLRHDHRARRGLCAQHKRGTLHDSSRRHLPAGRSARSDLGAAGPSGRNRTLDHPIAGRCSEPLPHAHARFRPQPPRAVTTAERRPT